MAESSEFRAPPRRTRISRGRPTGARPPEGATRLIPMPEDGSVRPEITEPAREFSPIRHSSTSPLEEHMKEYAGIAEKIRRAINNKGLTYEEKIKAMPLLLGPDMDASAMIERLGIPRDEYDRYADLHSEVVRGSGRDVAQMISNTYLAEKYQEAAQDFDIQNVLKRFFTPDENGKTFGREKRKEFEKMVTEYFYYFFEEVDRNPSKLYSELYNPYIHGYYINGLEGLLTEISNNKDLKALLTEKDPTAQAFLSGLGGYSKTIMNFGQIFHDLPIYALNPESHEQWKGFIAQLYPSELARFFDDPVMQIARTEITRHLKTRIALNGNQLPEDIFDAEYDKDTVIFAFKDHDVLRDNLDKRLRELNIEAKPWEIDRAISYGRGIGLLNLQDVQTMGLSDANTSYRSMPDIVAKMVQRHKWKQGRGGMAPTHLPELLTMDVVHNPESRSYVRRLFKRRKWVPKKIHEIAKKEVKELGPDLDYLLLDREGAYQELMTVFNLGDQITRAGWRIEHLLPGGGEVRSETGRKLMQSMIEAGVPIKEGDKLEERLDWGTEEWHKLYDVVTKELGSGALWFYLDKRVKAESYKMLGEALGLPMDCVTKKSADRNEEEKKKATEQYKKIKEKAEEYKEDKAFKKIKINNDELLTFYDLERKLEAEIKGENLYYLFRRSPGDFLLNLQLMVPDLLDFDPDNELWNEKPEPADKKDKKKKPKLSIKNHLILEKWGGRDSPGFKQLKKIHDWYGSLIEEYKKENEFVNVPELLAINQVAQPKAYERVQRDLIMKHVFEELGTAFEKVKRETETDKKRIDMSPEDVKDPKLRRLLFEHPGSPIAQFDNYKLPKDRTIPSNSPLVFDNRSRLTNENFFYLMGRGWTIKNGADNPSTTDLDYFKVYEEVAKVGQGMLRRLHADIDHWDKVTSTIGNLDELLMHTARTGDMSAIYKLHHEIHSLEGIIGIEPTQKANYLVASLVTQYFWEHSLARGFPGILKTIPLRLMLGKDISLSKIHQGRLAMTWDDKAVRGYMYNLAYEHHAIAEEGRWSYKQGQLAFDASTDTHTTNSIISASTMLFFYLIYAAAKKAMEVEGGKKR